MTGRQLALDLTTGAFGVTRLGRDADEDGDQLDLLEEVAALTDSDAAPADPEPGTLF